MKNVNLTWYLSVFITTGGKDKEGGKTTKQRFKRNLLRKSQTWGEEQTSREKWDQALENPFISKLKQDKNEFDLDRNFLYYIITVGH